MVDESIEWSVTLSGELGTEQEKCGESGWWSCIFLEGEIGGVTEKSEYDGGKVMEEIDIGLSHCLGVMDNDMSYR